MADSTIGNLSAGAPAQASDLLPIQRGSSNNYSLQVSDVLAALTVSDLPSAYLSGISGFWGGFNAPELGLNNSNPESSAGFAANVAAAYAFYLAAPITISKITIDVTALSASTFASAGIYSIAGEKLVDSGTFDCGTSGIKTNTITGVPLTPGWYYFVWTNSSTATGFTYFSAVNNSPTAAILNTNGTRVATGSATSGGALNSTLGTLTGITTGYAISIPAAFFE